MKFFSDNIIFFDTEFSTLDPYKGEILSIGMAKMNGEELYLEIEHKGEVSPWVRENLMSFLTQPKVSRREAGIQIKKFAGSTNPYLISYVNEFDAPYLYKLLEVNDMRGNKALPFHWIILDFASILFTLGRDPSLLVDEKKDIFLKDLDIDISKYRAHHALDDAKILRDVYLKLIS